MEYYSALKKESAIANNTDNLEGITLSGISQRKTNTVRSHYLLNLLKKKKKKKKQRKKELIDIENRLMVTRGD